MNNSFYRAFEERYRGSRQLILERLRVYSSFVLPLRALHQNARALDLGCGRGEWLELLGEAGFDASGVDLDDSMLAACRERGLKTSRADALATLYNLPDASVALVSAFHLVEHIPFEDVRALIAESLRVLQPGGLLIMETPNPENLVVGTSDFYNDPSHLHPIPPKLLVFATEHAGFARQSVLRLQEAPGLAGTRLVSLYDVLGGASPDFSVVAQKTALPAELAPFDAAFGSVHGVDVYTLAQRFDIARDEQVQETRAQLAQLADRTFHQTASASHEAAQALLGLGQLQNAHQALASHVQLAAQTAGKIDRRLAAVEAGIPGPYGPGMPERRVAADASLAALRDELNGRAVALQNQLAEHGAGIRHELAAQEARLERQVAQYDAILSQRLAEQDTSLRKKVESIEARLNVEHAERQEALTRFALDISVLQDRLEERLMVAEARAQAVLPHLPALLDQSARVDALTRRLEQRLAAEESNSVQLHARIEQAEAVSQHMSERVHDLLASRSWRLTAPLRVLGSGAIRLRGAMRRRDDVASVGTVAPRHRIARRLARAVLTRLRFRYAVALVRRLPWLHAQLYRLMNQGEVEPAEAATAAGPLDGQPPGGDLSPRALQIYNRLKRLHPDRMN